MFGLLTGLIRDVRSLFRQELQLLRDEFLAEMSKARQAAVLMGIGIGLALIGGIFIMIAEMLHQFADLPLWASYGTVGGVLIALGSVLLLKATKALQNFTLIPRQALHSMQDNAQWIKDQLPFNKT